MFAFPAQNIIEHVLQPAICKCCRLCSLERNTDVCGCQVLYYGILELLTGVCLECCIVSVMILSRYLTNY